MPSSSRPLAPEAALPLALAMSDDDDDFQNPVGAISLAQTLVLSACRNLTGKQGEALGPHRLGASDPESRPRKRARPPPAAPAGKENREALRKVRCGSDSADKHKTEGKRKGSVGVEEKGDLSERVEPGAGGYGEKEEGAAGNRGFNGEKKMGLWESTGSAIMEAPGIQMLPCGRTDVFVQDEKSTGKKGSYYAMSVEARLLGSCIGTTDEGKRGGLGEEEAEEFEAGTQLKELMNLCSEVGEEESPDIGMTLTEGNARGGEKVTLARADVVECPLCGADITGLEEGMRLEHTNVCLDREEREHPKANISPNARKPSPHQAAVDVVPVLEWLRTLGLSRYEEAFVREEIDWDTLQWLSEEDAFRYLRGDCSYWFLTHFHLDHYQGLTRNFCHGKIYCSSITAHLLNLKIGIPWDRLHVLPLNQKITVAGVDLTCLDANHCPGSIIILFEPPNGKPVLHTGDFRFCEKMACSSTLQSCHIHTLILDTTYCNPQYDFPKQEAVIQFIIEAIQAEAFNPKTLFLIGSYTIGKERVFLEVARFLRKKVYVGAAKLRLLQCLGLPQDDLQWFTVNEMESHIHVVPMWTIASFKRMKHISKQYTNRFSLIIAFSPTGWTYGKGKKKSPGRRWQQGTIVRYEVPYSEHSSFTELREFVKLLSPDKIIPSVNNDGPESADAMVTLLTSDPFDSQGNLQ